jgi:hypothetical protein
MRVLVACEFSGVVREAFLRRGHDAWSCDFLSGREPTNGRHVKGDVRPLLKEQWDLVIAHPPCTYLANSGVWCLRRDPLRYKMMVEACQFFNQCLAANAPMVCVENPIQHKYAKQLIRKQDQVIQPWQFGHGETKATCLWLKGLPKLERTMVVSGRRGRIIELRPGKINVKGLLSHVRSVTYKGIAEAMAEQWG